MRFGLLAKSGDQTKTFQAKIKRLEKINCGSSKIVFLHRALVIIFQIGIIIIWNRN